jgi:hypothetical protein
MSPKKWRKNTYGWARAEVKNTKKKEHLRNYFKKLVVNNFYKLF